MHRQCVCAAVVNSAGEVLVGIRNGKEPDYFGQSLHATELRLTETALDAASRMLDEKGAHHVVPIAVMAEAESMLIQGVVIRWALFQNCSEVGEVEPRLLGEYAQDPQWCDLQEMVARVPEPARTAYNHLAAWAPPILAQRDRIIEAIDFSGLWVRDASRNLGVTESLLARGLTPERAAAEACKPYRQRWQRGAETGSWEVTTFATHQEPVVQPLGMPCNAVTGDHPQTDESGTRTLVYPLGDWVEEFIGSSVLHGVASCHAAESNGVGELVRHTGWIAAHGATALEHAAPAAAEPPTGAAATPLLCSATYAHTTWTSRNDTVGEVVSRRLLPDGLLLVRRTYLSTPLRAAATAGCLPVVCEEIFARLA